ncbi:pentatricopeptide repeat-containing protein [Canna indica]|uniref:Pentatricopeptide repeat-containing protein n=1 Tax=Canna indica TaxID=4628 RepID=A0AAQ3QI93_9LILI|nr:pentatricopeptide repeat-containing protein [Canna indica]
MSRYKRCKSHICRPLFSFLRRVRMIALAPPNSIKLFSTVARTPAAKEPLSSLQCGQLLQFLTNLKSLRHGLQLHAHMVASGVLLRNTYLATKLCAMYAACARVRQARAIFDGILLKSSFLWNVMIRCYACGAQPLKALLLYREMPAFGKRADHFTYPFVLMACGDSGLLEVGRRVHSEIVICGYQSDVFVANSLLSMYSKLGQMVSAQKLFDRMSSKDMTSWNTMISGYTRNNDPLRSLSLFADAALARGHLDEATLLGVLPACADLMALKQGREIHAYILRSGMEFNGFLVNALIDVYAKSKFFVGARQLFERMSRKDTVSWNSMICGCARYGDAVESLSLFRRMKSEDAPPDTVTLIAVLGACDRIAALQFGMGLHAHLIRKGLENKVIVGTALKDMYAKCGSLECARQLFDEMPVRNLVSWSSMISGYGLHGKGKEAIACFNEMKTNGITPDEITFTSVLSACSHTGLVHEGKDIFYQMSKVYGLKPKVDHYSCVVDILGRAGDLEGAYRFIIDMDAGMDADIWEALLFACRIHHNIELAEIAAHNIFSLKPKHIGPYVCLSNMYAVDKRWNDAERVRALATLNGLKKTPGYSFVESETKICSLP